MIGIDGLCRRYGSLTALAPLTVTVPAGAVVGLLGANGAGKSTLLNVLVTLLEPSGGTARVAGHDIQADPIGARRVTGYVPESSAVYEGLTGDEFLRLAAEVRGLDESIWRGRADRLLSLLGLQDARGRRLGTYSKGMRAKTVLAVALLADPRVLVLDEPLNGLDVEGQRLIASLMRQFAADGRTVIYSSHVLEQVERTCDVLLLLHRGELLWQGRVDELRERHDGAPLADVFLRMTAPGNRDRPVAWAELLAG